VYGIVGYAGFNGVVGGQQARFTQGIWRMKPDGSKVEFLASLTNNAWGLGFSEEGHLFAGTANKDPSFYLHIPNRAYETVRGLTVKRLENIADSNRMYTATTQVRQVDHHGNYTAAAGHALYTARTWPSYYWNRAAFVAEPTGHVVGQFLLQPKGSGFAARNDASTLASSDEWTSPIAAEVGPDGQVWVIDWYNFIVQHNPIPKGFEKGKGNAYVTDLRDKRHGRIYRLVYKDGKPSQPFKLSRDEVPGLLAALQSNNQFWRMHAQRLLVERGDKSVAPELAKLVAEAPVDQIGLSPAAMHALWTMQGLGLLDAGDATATAAATAALKHKVPGTRKAAVDVLPRTEAGLAALLSNNLLNDADPQVRKSALLAMAEMPQRDPGRAARPCTRRWPAGVGDDRWLADAATIAAARHDAGFLRAALTAFKVPEGSTDAPKADAAANLIRNGSFEDRPCGGGRRQRRAPAAGGAPPLQRRGHAGAVRPPSPAPARTRSCSRAQTGPTRAGTPTSRRGEHAVQAVGLDQDGRPQAGPQRPRGAAERPRDRVPHAGRHRHDRLAAGRDDVQHRAADPRVDQLPVRRVRAGDRHGLLRRRRTDQEWGDRRPAGRDRPGARGGHRHYAQRSPKESVVQTLSALRTAQPQMALVVIDALSASWPEGAEGAPKLTDADAAELKAVMAALPPAGKDRLLALAGKWGRADLFTEAMAAAVKDLTVRLDDATRPPAARAEAARRLITVADTPETVSAITKHVNAQSGPEVQRDLLSALADSRSPAVGEQLVANWLKLSPAAQKAALPILLRREAWARSLLAGVKANAISGKDVLPQQWQALTSHPNPQIAGLASEIQKSSGQAVSADRKAIVDKLLPLAAKAGDAKKGLAVYERNCQVCHQMGDKGGKVGPDLTGVGARPKSDLLIEVVDPNRSVEGTVPAVVGQDRGRRDHRPAAEREPDVGRDHRRGRTVHALQRNQIKRLEASDRSVMPEGFEAIPAEELADLLEFLSTSKAKH
jgi:putative heme-binding domain-containing protein